MFRQLLLATFLFAALLLPWQAVQAAALAMLAPDKLLVAESGGDRIDVVNLQTGAVTRWTIEGLQSPAAACRGQD